MDRAVLPPWEVGFRGLGPKGRGQGCLVLVTLFADRVLQSKVCQHLFAMRMWVVTGTSGDRIQPRFPAAHGTPWMREWLPDSTEPCSGTGVWLCRAKWMKPWFPGVRLCVRGEKQSGIADCFKKCVFSE